LASVAVVVIVNIDHEWRIPWCIIFFYLT